MANKVNQLRIYKRGKYKDDERLPEYIVIDLNHTDNILYDLDRQLGDVKLEIDSRIVYKTIDLSSYYGITIDIATASPTEYLFISLIKKRVNKAEIVYTFNNNISIVDFDDFYTLTKTMATKNSLGRYEVNNFNNKKITVSDLSQDVITMECMERQ